MSFVSNRRGGRGRSDAAWVPVAAAILLAACRGPAGGPERVDLDRDVDFALRSARAGLWNEALYRWERAVRERPDDARLQNNLAVAYEHEGRYDDAAKAYEKARAISPKDDRILKNFEAFQNFREGKRLKEEVPDAEGAAPEPKEIAEGEPVGP